MTKLICGDLAAWCKEHGFGPQPKPNDYRIFKGTVAEFFEKAADDLDRHEKEAKSNVLDSRKETGVRQKGS